MIDYIWAGRTAERRWNSLRKMLGENINRTWCLIHWDYLLNRLVDDGFPAEIIGRIQLIPSRFVPRVNANRRLVIPRAWKKQVMALLEEK